MRSFKMFVMALFAIGMIGLSGCEKNNWTLDLGRPKYVKDHRTNLCFAYDYSPYLLGYTAVPCTTEVELLLDK